MSLISVQFFAFVSIMLLAYYLVPRRWQQMVVLVFSILFYLSYGAVYVIFILLTIVVTYAMGLVLNRTEERFSALRKSCGDKEQKKKYKADCVRSKKRIMLAGLLLIFAIWFIFKFTPLFSFSPLGISIYTFIAAGYCIDVYRGKFKAERNLLKYCSFITFFPHIIQGPFSRYDVLGETLFEEHGFDYDRFEQGMLRLVWGCFKKLVIADRMHVMISELLPRDSSYGGIYILWLIILLPMQLYADFSGYMDIVAGLCHMMGIRLQENFKQPFFARSVDEFWRRWHITLGAWFRDYLFYPVSMSKMVQKISSRCKKRFSPALVRLIPSYIALFFVWSATGLWHGSSPNFLLWGWINLFCIVTSMQFKPLYARIKSRLHIADERRGWQIVQMVRTYLIFGFAEMVSDIRSVHGIMMKCRSLVCDHNWNLLGTPSAFLCGLKAGDMVILAVGIFLMFVVDLMKERKTDVYGAVLRVPVLIRYACYAALFYAVILFGYAGTNAAGGFMYEQF